jgi:ferredoxin
VTFTDDKDGSIKTVKVPLGENLLEAAHKNDIDLEGEHCLRESKRILL